MRVARSCRSEGEAPLGGSIGVGTAVRRRAEAGVRVARGLEAVGARDGVSLTLGEEPGVGLAVVADRDRAMPQMDDFNRMGMADHGRRMMVIPGGALPRPCGRGHTQRGHSPLRCARACPLSYSLAIHPVQPSASRVIPGQDAPSIEVPGVKTTRQPVLGASDIRPVRTVERTSPIRRPGAALGLIRSQTASPAATGTSGATGGLWTSSNGSPPCSPLSVLSAGPASSGSPGTRPSSASAAGTSTHAKARRSSSHTRP